MYEQELEPTCLEDATNKSNVTTTSSLREEPKPDIAVSFPDAPENADAAISPQEVVDIEFSPSEDETAPLSGVDEQNASTSGAPNGETGEPTAEAETKPIEVTRMTYSEFDSFMEQASEVELFNCRPYWPTPGDIEMHSDEFPQRKFILFLSWLLDMNGEPQNDAERRSRKAMQDYIYQHLQFVDDSTESSPLLEEVDFA